MLHVPTISDKYIQQWSGDMGIISKMTEKPSVPVKTIKTQIPDETSSIQPVIETSITLKFRNGYKFTISYEDHRMIMKAMLDNQEVFFLDDIPEEFIEFLRRMLA